MAPAPFYNICSVLPGGGRGLLQVQLVGQNPAGGQEHEDNGDEGEANGDPQLPVAVDREAGQPAGEAEAVDEVVEGRSKSN